MRKLRNKLIAGLLALTVLVPALLYFFQEKLLFHPVKTPENARYNFAGNWEERWFETADGVRLHGLYFSVPQARNTVLYFHGNAGCLSGWGMVAEAFTQRNCNVLMIDYRGYGKSGGSISSQQQLLSDAVLVYDALAKEVPENELVLFGRSLGSGIAAYVAAQRNPSALLLETPYYSMKSVASYHMPWAPVGLVLKYELPTVNWLHTVRCPTLAVHGTNDKVIPLHEAQQLADELPNLKLTVVPAGEHNNLEHFAYYRQWLSQALSGS